VICSHCHADLPTTSFWKNRSTTRGYQNWCVTCLSPHNYPRKKATSKRWEQRHTRPGNGSRPEPRPRINLEQRLVRDHLHLVGESGLAYLVLLQVAKRHWREALPPDRFRSLFLCRLKFARLEEKMKEQGWHQPDRAPRERWEVCFADLGYAINHFKTIR